MARRAAPQPRHDGITISEGLWTWGWRIGQFALVIGGILWFAFQLYNDVGGLKERAREVQADVKTLFHGQEDITKTTTAITETLSRIEKTVNVSAPRR